MIRPEAELKTMSAGIEQLVESIHPHSNQLVRQCGWKIARSSVILISRPNNRVNSARSRYIVATATRRSIFASLSKPASMLSMPVSSSIKNASVSV
jgi:hypothetical protein